MFIITTTSHSSLRGISPSLAPPWVRTLPPTPPSELIDFIPPHLSLSTNGVLLPFKMVQKMVQNMVQEMVQKIVQSIFYPMPEGYRKTKWVLRKTGCCYVEPSTWLITVLCDLVGWKRDFLEKGAISWKLYLRKGVEIVCTYTSVPTCTLNSLNSQGWLKLSLPKTRMLAL